MMIKTNKVGRISFLSGVIAMLFLCSNVSALTLLNVATPVSTELEKYFVIGTGANDDAINIQNTELGANRKFLSDGSAEPNTQGQAGPNTKGDFYDGGNRWSNNDDTPDDAASVLEGIDWQGNLAVTDEDGEISLSDIDVYADTGVVCAAQSVGHCKNSISKARYFADQVSNGNGVNINSAITTSYDFSALNTEMSSWATFIEALPTDATITENIENQNSKDANGPHLTTFIDLPNDGISDGIAVIDIDVGDNDFEITNSDWILSGSANQLYIFRILNGSNVNISKSSILLGDDGIGGSSGGTVTELGAIFYHASEDSGSSDKVFNLNNVILNGIGLWDLNSSGDTEISVSNGQGCAQFLSPSVGMNNIRFTRCSMTQTDNSPVTHSSSYFPANGEYGTLMFEDMFPSMGDFDYNDLIVRYNVTVKKNSNTSAVTEIIWKHSLVAVGADYDNGFSTELPFMFSFSASTLSPGFTLKDTASKATVCLAEGNSTIEIGSCSNNICNIDDSCNGDTVGATCSLTCSDGSCTTSGDCSSLPVTVSGLPTLNFFASEKEFSGRNGFLNVDSANAAENWASQTPIHWQTVLTFSGDGATELEESQYCSSKGKLTCTYPVNPPFNPFITRNGNFSREIHLSDHLGTALYSANTDATNDHSGSSCGVTNVDNGSCFKTSSGLPWAIDIADDSFYAWPKEKHAITNVFNGDSLTESFAGWVESGGSNCSGSLDCNWWNANKEAKVMDGADLGDTFVLRTDSGTRLVNNTQGNFYTLSDLTEYDAHGLSTDNQGLADSMIADWNDAIDLDNAEVGQLCTLLDGPTMSYWVEKNGEPSYSSTRPYYVKNNETNSTALLHAYIMKYSDGSLVRGSSNINWSTLRDSLGGCQGSGAQCVFADIDCYIILESYGGSRQALGKWKE